MHVTYNLNEKLPPLAWAACCSSGNVEVLHGKRVEHTENFFVEGAWNGEYQLGCFEEADWFCGTGGHICKEKIIFSTPTHVIGALYLTKVRGGIV